MNGVASYGHWGRPVLAFPTEGGDAGEFEQRGMVAAIGELDVWGHDVAHDWPWWRTQLVHHLRRFC